MKTNLKKGNFKINNHIFVLINLLIATLTYSQPANFQWAIGMGGSDIRGDWGYSIKVDIQGNSYITGTYAYNADFDPSISVYNLTQGTGYTTFIAKYNTLGNLVWAKQLTPSNLTSGGFGNGLALDTIGNIYVTGYFSGNVDFDPGPTVYTMSPIGGNDIFILKLDNSGNFIWAKKMGGNGSDQGNGITVDKLGNIYTTGTFSNTSDFDPGPSVFTLTSVYEDDVYISKLDALGNFVWAKSVGGNGNSSGFTGNDRSHTINVDLSGNVIVGGAFGGTCDFDPGPSTFNLISSGQRDLFILKLSALGNFVWVYRAGNSAIDETYAVISDKSGNIFATGYFGGLVDFDNGPSSYTLNSLGEDNYVLKLNSSGNLIWVKCFGGAAGLNMGLSIDLDVKGNVYSTGRYYDTFDFDPGVGVYTLTPLGSSDGYISKLDPNGNFVWAKSIGGQYNDCAYAIAIEKTGNVYTTGWYEDGCNFNPYSTNSFSLNSAGSTDIFIHKIGQCIPPDEPLDITIQNKKNICINSTTTLSVLGSGTINWYSSSTASISIGSGTTFITPTLSLGSYTYYAESNTCTNSIIKAAIIVTVNSCLGFENELQSIPSSSIYPNPFNISTTIEFNFSILDAELNIYNLFGQKLKTIYIHSKDKFVIERDNLISGVYFYEITEYKKSITKGKIIIRD